MQIREKAHDLMELEEHHYWPLDSFQKIFSKGLNVPKNDKTVDGRAFDEEKSWSRMYCGFQHPCLRNHSSSVFDVVLVLCPILRKEQKQQIKLIEISTQVTIIRLVGAQCSQTPLSV